jgi:peroxiredoxin
MSENQTAAPTVSGGADDQNTPLQTGDAAPTFQVKGVHDEEIEDYSSAELTGGKAVLLGFYVFDFSPVCTRQMCQLTDMDWYEYKTELTVLGVCPDGPYSHM